MILLHGCIFLWFSLAVSHDHELAVLIIYLYEGSESSDNTVFGMTNLQFNMYVMVLLKISRS